VPFPLSQMRYAINDYCILKVKESSLSPAP